MRISRISFIAAFAFSSLTALAALPAAAQTCPYNSTQGSCACPTSGGGQDCTIFSKLYSSGSNSCKSDVRPCASNQQWDCGSDSCQCNTTLFPCGGCTAATSTQGAACGSPAGGVYANQCGSCGCPAGTSLIGGVCVGYANISPASPQAGYLNVTGDVKSSSGDFYLTDGKALRADGAGVTTLYVGNWGGGGTGVNLRINSGTFTNGSLLADPAPASSSNGMQYYNSSTGKLRCYQAGAWADCGGASGGQWTTAGSNIYNANSGNVGVGASVPGDKLTVDIGASGAVDTGLTIRGSTSAFGDMGLKITNTGTGGHTWYFDSTNSGSGYGAGKLAIVDGLGGAVRMAFDTAGNVGIGTTGPAYKLDVNGDVSTTNVHGPVGVYDVNLGGVNGRGVDAGYSGNAYGGIGYNIKHTASNSSYIAPGTDPASYLRFESGGFQFFGAPSGTAGRTLSMTNVMQVLQNGNVGLGMSDPQIRLAVGDNDTGLGWGGDGQLDLWSNNVNTMNIRSGNVGIGTGSPSSMLEVTSGGSPDIRVRASGTRGSGQLILSRGSGDKDSSGVNYGENDNTSRWFGGIPYNCGSNYSNFTFLYGANSVNDCSTSTTPTLVMETGGDVGIGKANPGTKLDVGGSANVDGDIALSGCLHNNATCQYGNSISTYVLNTDYLYEENNDGGMIYLGTSAADILVRGSLGVGQATTPAYPLEVGGTINANKGKTGIFLRANGTEAAYFDGSEFSWGYGGTNNYFADQVSVGMGALGGTGLAVHGGGGYGGYFESDGGDGWAALSNGNTGVEGYGSSAGGLFADTSNSGVLYAGHGNLAIDGYGNTSSAIAKLWNKSTSTGADGLLLWISTSGAPGTGNQFISFDANVSGSTAIEYGSVRGSGSGGVQFQTTSDARRKEHITDHHGSLETLGAIKVRDFNYIGSSQTEVGLIAQELYPLFPEVVAVGGEDPLTDPWGIDYGHLTPLIIGAVQEQEAKIQTQQAEIDSLKARLDALEAKLK